MVRLFFLVAITVSSLFATESTLLPVGTDAPSFVLPTPVGYREYLRTWCGEKLAKPFLNTTRRRVILSFWSTTCVPCMKEIPSLTQFVAKHHSDSMKVFLINLDNSTPEEIKTFVESKGWTLPVLLDPYQAVAKRFGVVAMPTVYILSPLGKVEHAFTGIPAGMSAEQHLESLLYPVPKSDTAITKADTSKSPTAKTAVKTAVVQK